MLYFGGAVAQDDAKGIEQRVLLFEKFIKTAVIDVTIDRFIGGETVQFDSQPLVLFQVFNEDVDTALAVFGIGKAVCHAEIFRTDVVNFAQDLPDKLLFEIRRMLEMFFIALYPQFPVFHLS
ncbi:hypothetical protein HMPREF9080_00127 [Cardiobacterium valvarum F0432]|uniref:Uncharacterized protein n=1 Tax=Cardiobacterium valvarum F0432 TaxID=797473 RepID=G9ZBK4_9GAMM|nr:hypothetical protein [Cardiobacterium valvarum]EHM56047.1 hypothetical protein HMPREF9080_00127 [Cardiobacterium valvarum F0432]